MNLNPIHKILLNTNGSITVIIEAITGKEVQIETIEQKIIEANKEIAELLRIDEGDLVNYRVVNLRANGILYVRAISYTPIKRLDERFKEDLMKADIPIGKILKKYNIEARREIRWKRIAKADKRIAKDLEIEEGSTVLIRNYNIIHKGEILMNITEFFPADRFKIT